MSVLEGYNSTILAYGQTGTGKTYTMEGFKFEAEDPYRGIVPRCMEEIFEHVQGSNSENVQLEITLDEVPSESQLPTDLHGEHQRPAAT